MPGTLATLTTRILYFIESQSSCRANWEPTPQANKKNRLTVGEIVSGVKKMSTKFDIKDSREVKHDVYGKRQKWNFSRLSSALCTVESKSFYLLWIVRDTFLFLCDLFKDYKKIIENQR